MKMAGIKGMSGIKRRKRIKKTCVVCGNKFEVVKSHNDKYVCCSKKCSNIKKKILMMNNKIFLKKHSEETKRKMREKHIGEKHWNWKGGISPERKKAYFTEEYQNWRIKVFERDNWTCQGCGKRGCYLEAHHIKEWANYPELRYDINNGVTLCKDCHNLTKKGRKTSY